MKKYINMFIMTAVAAVLFVSCKPFYQCGQPKPEERLFIPKRTQAVIDERDELCKTVENRNSEISKLSADISNLRNTIAAKEQQYNDLLNDNLSQAEQYNIALKQKSDELNAKERLLLERENSLRELQQIIARQDSITQRLNDILRNALLGFQSDELSVEIKNGKVYVSMSDKLLFKSGSAAVEVKGKEALKVLAEVLDKNPDIDILVEGHTDNVPIRTSVYKDNWDLSVARATSIVRILTDEYKIEPTRLTASGKGEFSPRASNAASEGRANNRRTEIILSPKLDEIMQLLKGN
jgi:chemotaxis protein MotB